MNGLQFTVSTDADGDMVATSTDPRLHEIVWRWTPGGVYVEYGLPGHPVGVVNVWDYRAGRCRIPATVEALAAELADTYSTPEAVNAARDEIAHG